MISKNHYFTALHNGVNAGWQFLTRPDLHVEIIRHRTPTILR